MLEVGAATRAKHGATISGDRYLIRNGGTTALLAVIDGLGGGAAAAEAANRAATAIDTAIDRPLSQIVQAAHQACLGTRGAVIGLLRLDLQARQATFVGVGNIGVYILGDQTTRPISRNGIVGYRLPALREHHAAYAAGDTFILYSDGISQRLSASPAWTALPPQALADAILQTFGKDSDDATVVVARPSSER